MLGAVNWREADLLEKQCAFSLCDADVRPQGLNSAHGTCELRTDTSTRKVLSFALNSREKIGGREGGREGEGGG